MIKKPRSKTASNADGLIGMFGHTLNEDGDIVWQFKIVRRSDDLYICQLYSWLDCGPTNCAPIARETILGPTVKLYETDDLMNAAYEKQAQRQRWNREAERQEAERNASCAKVS
jgi:hypothetical protein